MIQDEDCCPECGYLMSRHGQDGSCPCSRCCHSPCACEGVIGMRADGKLKWFITAQGDAYFSNDIRVLENVLETGIESPANVAKCR